MKKSYVIIEYVYNLATLIMIDQQALKATLEVVGSQIYVWY